MNALLNGEVLPVEEARRRQVAWMRERGITKPRCRIGQYYVPTFRPKMDAADEAVQTALLYGSPTWTLT
jgi:hypothetical protein